MAAASPQLNKAQRRNYAFEVLCGAFVVKLPPLLRARLPRATPRGARSDRSRVLPSALARRRCRCACGGPGRRARPHAEQRHGRNGDKHDHDRDRYDRNRDAVLCDEHGCDGDGRRDFSSS